MKIIMLEGPGSSGKTTTLNMVYDDLIASHGAIATGPKVPVHQAPSKDFEAVLQYNNKHIAIYSCGDFEWECIAAIVRHSDKDILILACNDNFTNLPQKVNENGSQHTVLNKTPATQVSAEAADNTAVCNTIIGLL